MVQHIFGQLPSCCRRIDCGGGSVRSRMMQFLGMIFSVSLLWVAGGNIAPVLAGDESRVVEVTGIGETHQAAKEDAIRNAVEKVVGSYVSSDLVTQNRQLIKDEVLNYSGGYIEKIDILSQERNPDGLYVTKVRALVINNKVRRKLEKINVSTRDLPSESLFAEAFSKVDEQKKSAQLISKIMEKYPSAVFVAEVGPPNIVSTDHHKNLAKVKFVATVSWDPIFIGELKEVLTHVSIPEGEPICFRDKNDPGINIESDWVFLADCIKVSSDVMEMVGRIRGPLTYGSMPKVDILFSINDLTGNVIKAVRGEFVFGSEFAQFRRTMGHMGHGLLGKIFLGEPPILSTVFNEKDKERVEIQVEMGINDLQRATKTQITFVPTDPRRRSSASRWEDQNSAENH